MKKLCIALLLVASGFCRINAQQGIPFAFQKNWYSKQMTDIFEDLAKKKYLKVEEGWQNVEKKLNKEKAELSFYGKSIDEILYPLWQLSHSVLLNVKEDRSELKAPLATGYAPWQAYSILKPLMSNWQTTNQINAFFNEKKLPFSMEKIKNDMEKNLIDTVRVVATEEAYDQLIDMLFGCEEMATLKSEREQIAFKNTIQTSDLGKCEEYMVKYDGQNSMHHRQVTMRRDSLAFMQMDTTVVECEKYLIKYPQSHYAEEVTTRMHRYAFNQLAKTPEACQTYLDKYPNSAYKKQVTELKVQYAFNEMKSAATIDAYRSFLTTYRHSDFASTHGMLTDAKQLMTKAFERKYINRSISLEELKDFLEQRREQFEDIGAVRQYYYNLLYMPTSAFMNGCDGLTGTVTTTHSQQGEYIQEIMEFNRQGLQSQHSHSKSGLSDSFDYVFDDTHGYQLVEKADNHKGRIVTYTTKYNDDGSLAEVASSDGSKVRYTYNGYKLSKVTYLKGSTTERTDYYDSYNHVEKSVRSDNTIVYEYNSRGDVVSMKKKKGSATMSTSTYVYEYPSDALPWQRMSQYNDGNILLTKNRTYVIPQKTGKTVDTYSRADQGVNLGEVINQVTQGRGLGSVFGGTANDTQVFESVEHMPSFPGGDKALIQFLNSHIRYPVVAEENGIQGKVVCSFVVERDGSITDIRVVKSVDPSLDKEAVRLLRSMPRWQPGTQGGATVRVKCSTPITFRLQ